MHKIQVGSRVKFKPWDEWKFKHGISKISFENDISYFREYTVSYIRHSCPDYVIFQVEGSIFNYLLDHVYQENNRLPEELFEL